MEPDFRRKISERERRRRYIARKRRIRLTMVCSAALIVLILFAALAMRVIKYISSDDKAPDEPQVVHGETFTFWNTEFEADPRKPKNELNPELFYEKDGAVEYLGMTETMQGIDVSSHNADIDWERVAADGIEFVIIRLGYRGATEGDLYRDKRFEEYYDGAKAAGLKVGAYFFSQAMTESEAKEEAKLAVKILDGRKLDLPLAYDWEPFEVNDESRTDSITREILTAVTKEFCHYVEKHGYEPMIYTNLYQTYFLLDIGELADHEIWYAGYGSKPAMYYEYRIWQYSMTGSVDGIVGDVDRDIWFKLK